MQAPKKTRFTWTKLAATALLVAAIMVPVVQAAAQSGTSPKLITNRVANVTQNPATDFDANDSAHTVPVHTGDTVKYLVRITNSGATNLTNVVYTDDLPTGVMLASDPSKRHIEHNLGSIKPGTAIQSTIIAKVTSVTNGQNIINKACFTAAGSHSGCDVADLKVVVPAASPSATPTPSATPSATPTAKPSVTPTPTATATPLAGPIAAPTPTPTVTPRPTATPIPTPVATATPEPTPTAAPVPEPLATPVLTPAPTATPSPTPSQDFACDSLQAAPQGGLDSQTVLFTMQSSSTSGTVTGFHFDFGDNTAAVDTPAATNTTTHTFAQPGTYVVTGQVETGEGAVDSNSCSVALTVGPPDQAPSELPPQVLSAALPSTGPENALAGVGGLGALGYAARAYVRSRKSLRDRLRQVGKTDKL